MSSANYFILRMRLKHFSCKELHENKFKILLIIDRSCL